MPENARRRRPLDTGGPWGTGLLLLGVGLVAQGVAYLAGNPDDLVRALRWVDQGVSIRLWAGVWLFAGLFSVVRALTPPQRHTDVAPAVAVIFLWSAVYWIFWIYSGAQGDWGREWISGTAWASLGALVVSWSRCVNPPTGQR